MKDEINSAYNGEPLTNRVVTEELLEGDTVGSRVIC